MKTKHLLLPFFLILPGTFVGQTFFAGVDGGPRLTFVHNDYISDYPSENTNFLLSGPYDYSFGYDYSLVLGLNFNDLSFLQLSIGNTMLAQRYDHRDAEGYVSRVRIKALDFPVLFRIGEVVYFEIGPWLSYVYDAKYDWDFNDADFPSEQAYEQTLGIAPIDGISGMSGEVDVSDYYKDYNLGMMLGVGGHIELGWYVTMITGLRGGIGLLDAHGIDNLGRSIQYMNKETGLAFPTNYFMLSYHLGLLFHLR
jgi:hypothetical protein